MMTTDLHIYNLDVVSPVYVVWNHVELWTLISLPPQMAERLRRAQPVSIIETYLDRLLVSMASKTKRYNQQLNPR